MEHVTRIWPTATVGTAALHAVQVLFDLVTRKSNHVFRSVSDTYLYIATHKHTHPHIHTLTRTHTQGQTCEQTLDRQENMSPICVKSFSSLIALAFIMVCSTSINSYFSTLPSPVVILPSQSAVEPKLIHPSPR